MKTRTRSSITALILAAVTLGAMQAQAIIIDWHPVGITSGQTARLTFANTGEIRGIVINWRFIDADGAIVAQSERPLTIPFGKMISVDLNRESLNGAEARVQIRAEVEVRRQPPPEGDKLRTSLEVFDNDTGKTTVFIGDPGI